ncbi:MAG: hypothetical protein ACRD0N_07045 [Acidimicrobiales bacterium]
MTVAAPYLSTATLTLCQAPGAPELSEGDVDDWLAADAVAAIAV